MSVDGEGCVPVPCREVAALRDSDCRPRFVEPWAPIACTSVAFQGSQPRATAPHANRW